MTSGDQGPTMPQQRRGLQIPPSVDEALSTLARHPDLGPTLTARIESISRSVLRAFAELPVNQLEIDKALSKIRRCQGVMESEPVGHPKVLEQLGELSSLLATERAPAPAYARAAAPPLVDTAPSFAPPTAGGDQPGRPAAIERPRPLDQVPKAVLNRLAELIAHRARLLAEPLASFGALIDADEKMQDTIWSASFIAQDIRRLAETTLVDAHQAEQRAAAVLALVRSGGADIVVEHLTTRVAAAHPPDEQTLLALRFYGDPSFLARVEPLLAVATGEARARLVLALGDGGRLSADRFIDLLDDPSDAVAVRAADLLAWVGRAATERPLIEGRLRAGAPRARHDSLLFAAVALGSRSALRELRRMLDAGEPVTARAIDTMAVAGDAGDAGRLLALAARDDTLAPRAVLAVGHLGSAASVDAITAGAPGVDDAVRARALQTIQGDERPRTGDAVPAVKRSGEFARPVGARQLYGRPWTIAGALDRLVAPDESLLSRTWYALEAVVRTGVRPGVIFDAAAPVAVQRVATNEIRRAIETERRPVRVGAWLYFGQTTD